MFLLARFGHECVEHRSVEDDSFSVCLLTQRSIYDLKEDQTRVEGAPSSPFTEVGKGIHDKRMLYKMSGLREYFRV